MSWVLEIKKADEDAEGSAWMSNTCDSCRRFKPFVLRIGPNEEFESSPIDLCYECLQDAFLLLERAIKQSEQPTAPSPPPVPE
jgi:hypothetical protein